MTAYLKCTHPNTHQYTYIYIHTDIMCTFKDLHPEYSILDTKAAFLYKLQSLEYNNRNNKPPK